jgi:ORF6N domain-containing protein
MAIAKNAAPVELIQNRIMVIRGEKVMIDHDLARLYGVETKQLKRAVRRNLHRFPSDFMFELTREEYNSLRSQSGTLKRGRHSKYLPFAFTEQGVVMFTPLNAAHI